VVSGISLLVVTAAGPARDDAERRALLLVVETGRSTG